MARTAHPTATPAEIEALDVEDAVTRPHHVGGQEGTLRTWQLVDGCRYSTWTRASDGKVHVRSLVEESFLGEVELVVAERDRDSLTDRQERVVPGGAFRRSMSRRSVLPGSRWTDRARGRVGC
jgi:hypothetical protein